MARQGTTTTKAAPKAATKAPTPQEAERALAEAQAAARELRERIDDGDLDVTASDLVTADAEVELATRRLAFAQRSAAEAEERRKRDAYLAAAADAKAKLPESLAAVRSTREDLATAVQERFDALATAIDDYSAALRTHRSNLADAQDDDEARAVDNGIVAIAGERFRPIGPVSEASSIIARILAGLAQRAMPSDPAVAGLLTEARRHLEAVAAGHAVKRLQELYPPPDDRSPEQVFADEKAREAQAQAASERATRNGAARTPTYSAGG